MPSKELAQLMNASAVKYIDPTINQQNSDLYDDVSAAYTIQLGEAITWSTIQILEVSEEANPMFLMLKYSDIVLGKLNFTNPKLVKLRNQRLTIDRLFFYGSTKSPEQEAELSMAKKFIVTHLENTW
jgi:hypothetical protein